MQLIYLFIMLFIFPSYFNIASAQERQNLKVDFVYDGDTFFADGLRVRLWGVQAPEFKTRRYFRAGAILEDMIVGKVIECEEIDIDKYNRKVMKCWIDGNDISLKMIQSGEAEEYTRFTKGYYKNKTIKD